MEGLPLLNRSKPIKRIPNLKPAEQEAIMQVIELLRRQTAASVEKRARVIIEVEGGKFQVYECRPTLYEL